VLVLLGADGTSTHGLAALTRSLALSMFQQTVGDLDRAWEILDGAARILPSPLTSTDPDTGEVTALFESTMLLGRPDGNHEGRLTLTLSRITWREQTELGQVRQRAHLYTSARDALVRACLDFLVWVEFAPETWRRQIPPSLLQSFGISLPKTLHQPTRKNLCERASKLRRFADPTQGDVSDSVWADIGGYPGLKSLALEGLGTQHASSWRTGTRPSTEQGLPVRTGCFAAWRFAQECSGTAPLP
jgi:hypothetical protein